MEDESIVGLARIGRIKRRKADDSRMLRMKCIRVDFCSESMFLSSFSFSFIAIISRALLHFV